ncbi:Zinc finger HIT domain-containing protein 3 [Varanus komodoensis]|nr:Zinc finger HIT domain-containing protein 3 [Varanus komodoensis]
MPKASEPCVVCGEGGPGAAKYRCPGCRLRYTWSVDNILTDDDEDDKVPLEKLQLLSKSEELRGILLNPHLRQLLVDVDRAEDKSFALRKSMQEPLFVEFADCCLRTVEPPEKENERPA